MVRQIRVSGRDASSVDEGAGSTLRKIAMLLELIVQKRLTFSTYHERYGSEYRSFQRDLQQLRAAGKEYGFKLSSIKARERVDLVEFKGPRAIDAASAAQRAMLAQLATLSAPVAHELGAEQEACRDGFVRLIAPRMADKSSGVYAALKAAWEAHPAPALVEFEYDSGKGAPSLRRVEPYRVLLRSGRDYLLGYDLGKKNWRTFGIDGIRTRPRRVGTIQKLRAIPPGYDTNDAIGFIKSGDPAQAVTVELGPEVAASVLSRQWQSAQTVENAGRGRARITFQVSDPAEVVRWALGLGAAARVIAPPHAVALAKSTVAEIAAQYR